MAKLNIEKKLTGSIMVIVILACCLCVTTFALVWANLTVENSLFHTGSVEINLNDGEAVIHENEFLFEPGMLVEKEFFIKNDSTCSVYYKLYLDDVRGGLADVLEIKILDGDKILYQGVAKDLTKDEVVAADDMLQIKEKRNLKITFYYPKEKGNDGQGLDLSFTIGVDATQTKNNPNRLFD